MPVEDAEWPDAATGEDVQPDAVTDPLHIGPPVTTPGLDLEPQPEGDEDESGQAGEDEPLPEFDHRVREDFEGLLYLGRLEHKFPWAGHDFVIRTLTTGEVLEVGLITRPYRESLADVKAYQAAVVAACVLSVDGRPLPGPITKEANDSALRNRFEYVLRSWYPWVLDVVYEEYLLLEDRVEKVIAAMGNRSR